MTALTPEALEVIEKVRKLLALANNNPNEHEAAAAADKAMKLLEAYNLDMSSVERTRTGRRADEKRQGGLYKWQRNLWHAVARLHFCVYEEVKGLTAGSKYEHRVIGSQANVVGTELMADYLVQTIERLTQKHAKAVGYNVFCRDMIAYREGMASRLVERLNTLRWERQREEERKAKEQAATTRHPGAAPASNSLVLASVIQTEEDLNNDYLYGYEPGTHARRRAEREARQAAAQAAADQALALRDAQEAADPSIREARLAEEAAREAKRQAEYDKWAKKQAKKQANRKPRYRNATPEEERAMRPSFQQGRSVGDKIGLDTQIDKQTRRAVK